MTDIPDDIREKARALAWPIMWLSAEREVSAIAAFEQALMEMREATARECAEHIEKMKWYKSISEKHVLANEPRDYAAAIRSRFLQPEASAGGEG